MERRNNVLGMLWAYALTFALYLILGNSATDLKKAWMIAFIFSVIMELLQLTALAKGTFDLADIVVEMIAEITAGFIIKKYFLEEEKEIHMKQLQNPMQLHFRRNNKEKNYENMEISFWYYI